MRILDVKIESNVFHVYDDGLVEVIHAANYSVLSLYDLNVYHRIIGVCRNTANLCFEGRITKPFTLMEVDFGRASAYNGFLGAISSEHAVSGELPFRILHNPNTDSVANIGQVIMLPEPAIKPYLYESPKERADKLRTTMK